MGGDDGDGQKESKHKEEGERRRKIDAADRTKIAEELHKHLHPLIVESTDLYNIVNGQIMPAKVNIQVQQHSKRAVNRFTPRRIPWPDREESEDHAGDEKGSCCE